MISQNSNHAFYTGLGNNPRTTSLPLQTVSDSKKGDKFGKSCMDALESIGLSQKARNIEFREFYKMGEGRLVYSDFDPDANILTDIKKLGDEVGVPTFVKHYDFIGIFVNQLTGEWLDQRDDFKIDLVDGVSKNDFIRERTERVKEYALKQFEIEIEQRLIEKGLDPYKKFDNEEEKKQYLQYLQQQKDEILSPKKIESDMQKNWKLKAAEWAEGVIESDQSEKHLNDLDESEMRDFCYTGRYFRHYHIGYDFYEPERWDPIDVFFSEDVNAKYPQEGEYVGRVFNLSPSDTVKRYGHLMSPKDITNVNKGYAGINGSYTGNDNGKSWKSIMGGGFFGETVVTPFEGYFDYDLGRQVQDALDIPMGTTKTLDKEGNEVDSPYWLPEQFDANYRGYEYASIQRDDISVRTDLLQITEAYWRSWKRMWFLHYLTEDGLRQTEIVTDDLVSGFIKDNGIKKVKTKSIKDFKENFEDNTMYEFWVPEVWKGVKINDGNSFLGEPIYLDVKPYEHQIRSKSNMFDALFPVGGIISSSICQKIRPYQIGYNICWNQIINLLEKEIGTFFLFDINFLPSEYRESGNAEEALLKVQELAKSTGLVPLDTKKDNMQGANPQMNTFMAQDISFDKQIQSRFQLAGVYYNEALKQIGITPQRLGNPGKYETASGVEQGVQASYTQTLPLFNKMSTARKKSMELHLSVAQYCQKNYIDADFLYSNSDGDKQYINLTDPDFPLRRIGLIPVNDPKKRRELDTLKRALLENNTIDRDTLEYVEIATSDTVIEMVEVARRNRMERQAHEQQVAASRKEELQMQLEHQANEKQADREWEEMSKQRDRQTDLQEAKIDAMGKVMDDNGNANDIAALERASDMALKEQQIGSKIESDNQKNNLQEKKNLTDEKLRKEELELRKQELRQKDKLKQIDYQIAIRNKN